MERNDSSTSSSHLENDPLSEKPKDLADKLGDAHLNILPTKKLMICLFALSLGLFTAFADQTSITIALSNISKDLNAETTINWAGTASLLANCVCQVLFGRLADIFGRKNILLTSLGILAIADLACGFAQTGVQFYIFRAFAGIGQGGIQSLTMVMLSDICTLKQRGRYQGILGSQVGLGNALGPFIMSGFIEHSSWRNFYHMMPPLIVLVMITVWYLIDSKRNAQQLNDVLSRREKFRKIDYLGMLFSTASLTLLLIPISGGGSTYAWDSSIVIAMFVVGGLCFVGFLIIEWKVPKLPMIPLGLFTRFSLSLLLGTNFLYGMAYYAFTYYLPYYFQIVRGLDSIHSSVILLPLVLTQSIFSITAGQLMSYTGHYYFIVVFGYGIWTVACGLCLLFDDTTTWGVVSGILIIMGIGVGFIFQPSMVAVQSLAKKAERAVVISARNVLRSFGGAVGIAVASLIVSNSLLEQIKVEEKLDNIPTSYLNYLKSHIFTRIEISNLDPSQVQIIKDMYMKAIKDFFYLCVPLLGICFVGSLFVKDHGLHCIDEIPEAKKETSKV
ncbi:major facilitator superfamily domain-containing protein [Scheffersomyces coipomensis]|uniref:major facilitator superfamily domain-containing protein n=1 Tax=Scheffersomyces coipomensis TaxID=1788519 RepID=UPI00315D6F98